MTLPDWVRLAPATALPRGAAVCADIDGERVAVFHTEHGYRALAQSCPHMGGPLSEGEVTGGAVICPLHRWRYDLSTGTRLDRPGQPVETYCIEVRHGWLYLALSDEEERNH
ncbi:Rieske 2Fe-2S domain-containing protein [Nonomuraea sp. B5E05]|uniref:Rieske (2Fe-2S) protein n=1 Tax=Nonomuraea sp. B5E05 TaxID=3153569 RepID=UPI0032601F31